MSRKIQVYLDGKTLQSVGTLWIHRVRGGESASFEYAREWLEQGFALEPALPLLSGVFHTEPSQAMFRSFSDSAPDRWGRVLLQRQENRLAREERRTPRALMESDFLLDINDATRQGALCFKSDAGEILTVGSAVPPYVQLRALMQAATSIANRTESMADIKLLLSPGSSLGGARPKASVLDEVGNLMIAKFPHPHDEWDVPLWEYIAYRLAAEVGLKVPEVRLETVNGRHVLLVQRFDRKNGARVPFASAMTLLGASDGESRSYLDIAEIIIDSGEDTKNDLKELWRRMLFNMLISNVDDHLRNHGFLRGTKGWMLSPVYDLESTPVTYKAHVLRTAVIDDDGTADPELAIQTAGYYGIKQSEAEHQFIQMKAIVSRWEVLARQLGAARHDIDLMEMAFRQG